MFCKWKVMMCLEDMFIIVLALVEHKEVPYNKLIKLLDFSKSQMLSSSFWWYKRCFELFAKESFEDRFIFVETVFDYRNFSFYWHRMLLFRNSFKKLRFCWSKAMSPYFKARYDRHDNAYGFPCLLFKWKVNMKLKWLRNMFYLAWKRSSIWTFIKHSRFLWSM